MTFGRRVAELAAQHPDKPVFIYAPQSGEERVVTWREYDRGTNRIARLLAERGIVKDRLAVAGIWNCPEHYLFITAAWKLGAPVLPMRPAQPPRERDQMLELVGPTRVLAYADWDDIRYPRIDPVELAEAERYSDEPLDEPPHPGKAIGSGGSTGRSKIVRDRTASPVGPPEDPRRALGMDIGQVQLLAAPLYHNAPFLISYRGLALDHTLVIMERFNAEKAVDLIERHKVSYAYFPPIIMRRILMVPGVREGLRDFSSFQAMHSSSAMCPIWLKQAWIDMLGAEKVNEVYGSSEGIGATIIGGDEWLEHRGSVGKSTHCETRILDPDGNDLPPGEVGEIFMRRLDGAEPTFEYIGAPPLRSTPDGFVTVGDLGWLDEDDFLYIADRRVDMIVSGGANVYPAEVESALSEHPEVADVVVVGVPDEEWGRRVHAVIQPRHPDNPPSVEELDRFARERITSYKLPKTYELLAELPRNEAGKIRRTAIADERQGGWLPGMLPAPSYARSRSSAAT